MAISIRLSDADTSMIRDFAALYGKTISEFIRDTVIERIEDEIDIKAYKEAKAEIDAGTKTYTMEDVKGLLSL